MTMELARRSLLIAALVPAALLIRSAFQGETEPWTKAQLLAPADLAREIKEGSDPKLVIYDIGPSGSIAGSIPIGPTREPANMDRLRQRLSEAEKDAHVVLYCGCCPFANCPNIRPAFALVKEMGFTRAQLLDLPHNLKTDWIDRGYPLAQ